MTNERNSLQRQTKELEQSLEQEMKQKQQLSLGNESLRDFKSKN